MNDYTSIIVVSHIPNPKRAEVFQLSLTSLIETTKELPCEIIVVDNGGNSIVSELLLSMSKSGKIQHYIRNSTNLSFGIGRNQGYACASGNYICIADNDILYKQGWLQACLHIMKKYPDKKIYSSCIEYPTGFLKERYDVGTLDGYNLNMRAGSNCFVVRRKDYIEIGGFYPHRIAGTKWTDKAVKLGYVCAVSPEPLCEDIGIRNGYAHSTLVGFKKVLTNREEVYLNRDEFKEKNPKLNYA